MPQDNIIKGAIRESKRLERANFLSEALQVLEEVLSDISVLQSRYPVKLTLQFCHLSIKIATSDSFRRVENLLNLWESHCKKEKVFLPEPIKRTIVSAFPTIASCYQQERNFSMALKCVLKVLKTSDELTKKDSELARSVARARYIASSVYIELKKYQDSISQAEKALVIYNKEKKLNREVKPEFFLEVFYNIGFCHCSLGNMGKMKDFYNRALGVLKEEFDDEHPLFDIIKKALKDSYNTKTIKNQTDCEINEEPKPRRYYSNFELEKLKKRLQDPSSVKFVSADDYFYTKINRVFNLENDVKFIKNQHGQIYAKDSKEKQKISELRLRRHCRRMKGQEKGVDYIKERIDLINKQEELNSRKLNVQLKSRMKSISYRKMPNGLNEQNGQRKLREITTSRSNQQIERLQGAKDDIEGLMEELDQEIKKIDLHQRGLSARVNHKSYAHGPLARSAWDRSSDPSKLQKVISTSLVSALKNKK